MLQLTCLLHVFSLSLCWFIHSFISSSVHQALSEYLPCSGHGASCRAWKRTWLSPQGSQRPVSTQIIIIQNGKCNTRHRIFEDPHREVPRSALGRPEKRSGGNPRRGDCSKSVFRYEILILENTRVNGGECGRIDQQH